MRDRDDATIVNELGRRDLRGGARGPAVPAPDAWAAAPPRPRLGRRRGPRCTRPGRRRAEAADDPWPPPAPLLGFQGIATSTADAVVVPPGYTARVLISWGDPVSNGPAFKQDASNTAAEQAQQWGMHNDGVVFFPIGNNSNAGLLVQNNEYSDDVLAVHRRHRRLERREDREVDGRPRRVGHRADQAGVRPLRRRRVAGAPARRGTPVASPPRRRCGSAARPPATPG